MATSRPFTYNTSSTVPGTEQLENLAIGLAPFDYSSNPGGLKWWMGPDEDNRYIIGKDVPSKNWPTPVPEGDIGSVRFWATSTEDDTQFVDLTNSIGNQSFTTVSSSLSWLKTNGYWNNYLTASEDLSTNSLRNKSGLTNFFFIQSIYNVNTSDIYVNNSINQTSYRTPAVFNNDNFPYDNTELSGDNFFLSPPITAPLSFYPHGGLMFKSSSNELYAVSFGNTGQPPGNVSSNFLSKWDVTTTSASFTGSITTGSYFEEDSDPLTPLALSSTYNHIDDLIYFGARKEDGSGNSPQKIYIYSSSNFTATPNYSTASYFDGYSGTVMPILRSSTDTSGKVLVMNAYTISSAESKEFKVIRGENLLHSGSFDAYLFAFSSQQDVVYDNNTQKWYLAGAQYNNNGIWLASIDSNTYEVNRVEIESGNQNGLLTQQCPIALDPNRNCIWIIGRLGTNPFLWALYAVDLETFTVVKSRLDYFPNISGQVFNTNGPTQITIDSNNDILFLFKSNDIYRWDLNDFWPI